MATGRLMVWDTAGARFPGSAKRDVPGEGARLYACAVDSLFLKRSADPAAGKIVKLRLGCSFFFFFEILKNHVYRRAK